MFGRDDLAREIERLRDYVERRAQTQENLVRAMLAQSTAHVAEALEGRIQLATREAIAFAEQGLDLHDAALAAFGRKLAEFSREPTLPLAEVAPAEARDFLIGATAARWSGCTPLPASEAGCLPILPEGAARLVVNELVEQFTAQALSSLLAHWRSRLMPEGELIVVTLDGPALAADLAALRARLAAASPLRQLFDAERLGEVLRAAGFAPSEPIRSGRMLEVVARRGS